MARWPLGARRRGRPVLPSRHPAPPPPSPPPVAPVPAAGPPPAPPAAADPPSDDSRPATLAEVRSLRRWLVVAAVWAVAATVVSVLAFVTASDDDAQRLADPSNPSRSIQRRVNRQVRQLERRLAGVAQSSTVAILLRQVKRLDRVRTVQNKQLASVDRQLENLRQRIEALARAPAAGQTDTTTAP